MTFAFILPHLLKNGGVRRFIEMALELNRRGHQATVYVPDGCRRASWLELPEIKPWSTIRADVAITGDTSNLQCLEMLEQASAPKKYIYIIVGSYHIDTYRKYEHYPFLLNNRVFKKYFNNEIYMLEGGVSDYWKPKNIKIVYQFRKRTIIEKELGDLKHIELISLNNLGDEEMREAYRNADYCVVWEKREGWANTAAEALSCGTPVVTNGVNCEPIADKVIQVKNLRDYFNRPTREVSYKRIIDKLLSICS